MLEIIYRIYEVIDKSKYEDLIHPGILNTSISKMCSDELLMDVCICESRDQFKSMIRDTWGEDIAFRYSSKMKPGSIYCIIIGEHCYTTDRYFNRLSYKCSCCNIELNSFYGQPIEITDSDRRNYLYNIHDYDSYRFCTYKCKENFLEKTHKELQPDDDSEFFVSRDMFTSDISGYIYKITRRSTKEFYVGQTKYLPMFRWAEHMKTARFPTSNIDDYIFEVIEIVPSNGNILDREKYWIQKLYLEHPDLSLNISQTQLLRKENEMN